MCWIILFIFWDCNCGI